MSSGSCNIKDEAGRWMLGVSSSFDAMLRDVNTINTRLTVRPTPASVTMMTITGKLSVGEIPLATVLERLVAGGGGSGSIRVAPITKGRGGKAQNFSNQLALMHGRMAIKLFRNGSIHFTGCRSVVAFVCAVDGLCDVLRDLLRCEDIALESAEIRMINMTFSAGRSLPLVQMRDACARAGLQASYDPDVYPAINVKVPLTTVPGKHATCIAFKTGKVMFSGARAPEDLTHVYGTFCTIMDRVAKQAPAAPLDTTFQPVTLALLESWSLCGGYSSRIAHLCAGSD